MREKDDGYRAIHLYYQRDSYSYPIEIQLWCGQDYEFNIWAYKCTTVNEARCLPGTLEAIRETGVQIVILNDPEIYAEYAPYEYIIDMGEFIDRVKLLNKVA